MKKKLVKIVLLVGCGLVVYAAIAAVLRSREEKRLKAEIAGIQRTLREQGFKTELDDFKVTTDAAMKARVKTLLALGYEPQLDSNEDVIVLQPVVSNGVAPVIWKQNALTLGTNAYPWANLRAKLNEHRDSLDAACDAAMQGPIQSVLDLTNLGSFWNGNIGNLHRISRTLGYRVILNLHDGHPDMAWTNLLAATRLVTALKVDATPISHLIRAAITDNDYALTWQALQFNHWPDDRLAALEGEWELVDFFTNLSDTMALEREDDFNYCQKLWQQPSSGDYSLSRILKLMFDDPSEAFREAEQNYQDRHYRGNKVLRDEVNLLRYFQNLELEFQKAIQSPTWAQMRVQPGFTNPPVFKSPSEATAETVNSGPRGALRLMAFAAMAETERRMLITAIALERYHGKYGAYPPTLDPLAPEFLKTVPPDFMDGQPLRYHPTADGHFLLYSVGLDCVDDGGKPLAPDELRFGSFEHGKFIVPTNADIVWPAPAAP